MNTVEAGAVAVAVLEPLRELDYQVLVDRYLGNPDTVNATASTGVRYQVEIEAFRDSPGCLRLIATADDYGRRHVSRDFLIASDGSFVGEVTVFTLDGHDIVGFTTVAEAAMAWEGLDAPDLDYIGADGTVYAARVDGPGVGRVQLAATDVNRLDELLERLRSAALASGLVMEADLPRDPRLLWDPDDRRRHRSRRSWRQRP